MLVQVIGFAGLSVKEGILRCRVEQLCEGA